MSEKLQKVLARAGLGSRRTIETWIAAGRITINGNTAKLGDRVDTDAKICIDNRPVKLSILEPIYPRVILYNKPEGQICARHDPEGRPTVFEHLPFLQRGRWVMIGRLDFNTLGLLLFTTDGELANRLMHPSSEIEREYAVRVFGHVNDEMIQRLHKGVHLEDGMARFDDIVDAGGDGSNHWYHVVVKEGKNRLVRRLWESQGVTVSRLTRVRFGNIALPRSLRPGRWEELEPHLLDQLLTVSAKNMS